MLPFPLCMIDLNDVAPFDMVYGFLLESWSSFWSIQTTLGESTLKQKLSLLVGQPTEGVEIRVHLECEVAKIYYWGSMNCA